MKWLKAHWFWITGFMVTLGFFAFIGCLLWEFLNSPECLEASNPFTLVARTISYGWDAWLALSIGLKTISTLLFAGQLIFIYTLCDLA